MGVFYSIMSNFLLHFFLTLGLSELHKENNRILHTLLLLLFFFFFQKDENVSFPEGIWGWLSVPPHLWRSLYNCGKTHRAVFVDPAISKLQYCCRELAQPRSFSHSSPHPFKAQIRPVRIWKQGWRQGRAKMGGGVYLDSQRKSRAFFHSPSHSPGP